jgi:hypothetical protein
MAKRGQIDLFTRRVRTAPPPIERRVHIAIADTIRIGIEPGWIWWHTPNGELRSDETGALLQRMGVQSGISDFLFLDPLSRLFALELKRKGKKPTDAQKAFLMHVALGSGDAKWVDNFDDAITVLKRWGVLSERVKVQ